MALSTTHFLLNKKSPYDLFYIKYLPTEKGNFEFFKQNFHLLTDIVDQLYEPSEKINVVGRLSRRLSDGVSKNALSSYLSIVKSWCPAHPVIHIDGSDLVKPEGFHLEDFGRVRDGSKSTATKNVCQKGCHVTEAAMLTNSAHPVSVILITEHPMMLATNQTIRSKDDVNSKIPNKYKDPCTCWGFF